MQQGLANNNTNDVCFDKNGFVWITSLNGLNLFDGKNVFHFNKQTHPELPVNQLSSISCDSRNRIWVCSDFGLSMLDERRKVNAINIQDGESRDIDFCFEVLKKGMIIVGINKNYFLQHDESKVKSLQWLDDILNGEKVLGISRIDDAQFLFQQKNRIVVIDFLNKKLKFDLMLENLASACILNNDELLAVTQNFQLHRINYIQNKTINIQTGLKDQGGRLIKTLVRSMIKAANGKIYLTTKGEGMYEYDIDRNTLFAYQSNIKNPNSISTNVIHLGAANEDGYLALTSDLGIQYTNVNNFGFERRLYGQTGKNEIFFEGVKSILLDKRKQLWISTANNLVKTDSNGNQAMILNQAIQESSKILSPPLQMDLDGQDNVWVPFRNEGLYVFDHSGSIIKSFKQKDISKPVTSLRLVKKVNYPYLLVGTDKGLFAVHSKLLTIDSTTFKVLESKLDKERIVDILYAGEDIWITTSPNGSLWNYNLHTKRIKQFTETNGLPSNRVYCLAASPQGDILVGTYEGLSVIRNGKIIKTLTIQNGLMNPRVDNIQVDEHGFAWITNHNAIIKYDLNNESFQYFDERNGITNFSFSIASGFQTNDKKEIFFGTTNGLIKFQPGLVNQKIIHPKTVITRLLNDNLVQNVSLENNFKLPYKDAKINFYFTSSELIAGSRIMYRYMLVGLDDTWSAPTANQHITYNLSPGTYTFRLQTSYNSSDWIEGENVAVITVTPPFWQKMWFIVMAALFFLAVGLLIFTVSKKRKIKAEGQKLIEFFATADNHYSGIDDYLWEIARNIVSRLNFEDCVIYLVEEKDILVQKAAAGPKNPAEKELINLLEIPIGEGIVGTAAATKKPVLVKDTSLDNRYIRDDAKRFSELAVPIIHNNETIGIIDSEHSKKNFYTNEHVRIISSIAAISAEKIASLKAKNILAIQENRLKELDQQMIETRLSAIRAQMNPHFLFNSLNAIQECIISEKYDAAYEYLSRFSKLLRLVLNHSEKNFISLKEELETIQLYLSLEELRFNHTFTYEIVVNDDIETDDIMVPSLLLQPFVENAIWHGLINKQGIKKLKLSFKEEKNMIKCIIEDNGIGRKRSAWIKEQKLGANQFSSKGTMLSEKRIQILNQQFSNMAQIETIDHYDQGQRSMGTSVIITLPLDIENN